MDTADGWFKTEQINSFLYLIYEPFFDRQYRANIWLIKGPGKDVVIDAGLGVCNLREYLESEQLVSHAGGERECVVLCTHAHYDHSGGAHHFENVFIHEGDFNGLRQGRQIDTLNYVKDIHFGRKPYRRFSASQFKVPPTACQSLSDGDRIDVGGGEHLQIIHTPGHTKGSVCVYYPQKAMLFTGDFVYNCHNGKYLLDWLPTSNVADYIRSANQMIDFISEHSVVAVFPGHFDRCSGPVIKSLLEQYADDRDNCSNKTNASCSQCLTGMYFYLSCFRCCPC